MQTPNKCCEKCPQVYLYPCHAEGKYVTLDTVRSLLSSQKQTLKEKVLAEVEGIPDGEVLSSGEQGIDYCENSWLKSSLKDKINDVFI